jgi:mRNA interferase YafQ
MKNLRRLSSFKKDYKRCVKRGYDIDKLYIVIEILASGERLATRYQEHFLQGEYKDCRECYIQPDWLLIYRIVGNELHFLRTGTHANLFE